MTALTQQEWQVRAACRGPQAVMFFPPASFERKDEKLERERRAKSICAGCSVRKDCLEYALRIREPHGIWGGLNEAERRTLLGGAEGVLAAPPVVTKARERQRVRA